MVENQIVLNDKIRMLEDKIPFLLNKHKITGISIVLIENAQIAWNKEFGYRNRGKNLPILPETLFEAASLTKPLVAFITLKLAEEDLLDLSKPLANYLIEPYLKNEPLLKLITHPHYHI